MTGRLLTLLLILASSARVTCQGPYIREESVGSPALPRTADKEDFFSPLPTENWIGQKFILMPLSGYEAKRGYMIKKTPDSDSSYIPYTRYKGKIVTVIAVQPDRRLWGKHTIMFKVDETGETFFTSDFLGHVPGWALKRDIDYVRSHWIGKVLWLRNSEAETYNAVTKKTDYFRVKNLSPVKVLDVVLSDCEGWPLRFIVEDERGQKFIKIAKLSGTNSGILENAYKFNDVFFTDDPRKVYPWDAATFAALEEGKLSVGMTKEQARISWGNPLEVNRTISDGRSDEQWVYGGHRYVYFQGERLTSIQD